MVFKTAFVVSIAEEEKERKGEVDTGSQRVDEFPPCVAASFTNWQINSKVAKIRSFILTGYFIIIVLDENVR